MGGEEAYMLPRNSQESKRLDFQHDFLCNLSNGHLIHSSIACKDLRTIADIATGTGIWLQELAESGAISRKAENDVKASFVGFDISPQQFPAQADLPSDMKFVVHDMTEPFPQQYHERFDLVNIRLVSYAIKAIDLEKTVRNVLQIIRPGGYLQWRENDTCDVWTTSATPVATAMLKHVTAERVARGLLPAIITPLISMIQSFSTQTSDWRLNPVSWTSQLMRITHLELLSTRDHHSPAVAAAKCRVLMNAVASLLQSGVSRKKAATMDPLITSPETEKLSREIEEMTGLIETIKRGDDLACKNWELEVAWVVARKAIILKDNEAWMSIKYPA